MTSYNNYEYSYSLEYLFGLSLSYLVISEHVTSICWDTEVSVTKLYCYSINRLTEDNLSGNPLILAKELHQWCNIFDICESTCE